MQGQIKWLNGVSFEAESETGHKVILDGPPESGGANKGMRPMEMIMLGVGGCASYDVVTILKKARQEVAGCVATLSGERVDSIPAVFEKLHMHFIVTGRELKESQVKRAVELSAERYCSGSIMLGRAGVKVTHSYEIKDSD